jgi:3-deoxy-7-phosphoheptulonate synthase
MLEINQQELTSLPEALIPLPTPEELALTPELQLLRDEQAALVTDVLHNQPTKLVAILGECSISDPEQTLHLNHLLRGAQDNLQNILLVQRVNAHKPRTNGGAAGMAIHPTFDEHKPDMATGLRLVTQLYSELLPTGVPLAAEALDPAIQQYLGPALAYEWIGARSVAHQPLKDYAAGRDNSIGVKNGMAGGTAGVEEALNLMQAASHPRAALEWINGRPYQRQLPGNPNTNIILRGGAEGPNCDAGSIIAAANIMKNRGRVGRIIVDMGHGNAGPKKDPGQQLQNLGMLVQAVQNNPGLLRTGLRGVMVETSHTQISKTDPLAPLDDVLQRLQRLDSAIANI